MFVIDWASILLLAGRVLQSIFSLVSGFLATTVLKYEWQQQHKL